MLRFIQNIGEYFSSNYFDEDFTQKVLSKTGYAGDDVKSFNRRITPLKDRYYRLKQLFIERNLRVRDKVNESHKFHNEVLKALGYDGEHHEYNRLFHLTEQEVLPIRHTLYRGDQVHLMIMEMQALIKEDDKEPDGLFEQQYNVNEEVASQPPQRYHRSQWSDIFQVAEGLKISPKIINEAVSELFLIEQHRRPKYILLLAGNVIFLLEQEKWFKGSYLQIDLEELFSEATASPSANYYALIYFLLGKDTLAPDSNMVLLDQLDEDSHKSAYEVTKDLKEGIIHAVEALANEALYYMKNVQGEDFDETNDAFEQEVKDDCLTIIYRLLFIFYAESREDIDILPSNDSVYSRGYSLEMLRELEQVPLHSAHSRDRYFFHESLQTLFSLLSSGYREKETAEYDKERINADPGIKINKSFRIRHIDSPLFNDAKLHHLHRVKFRNIIWQDIICRLSLSKEQRGRARGRISYANLGINQLGSVYESLLAYRGFYAEQDYIEVHKAGEPREGTYLVPRQRRDDFQEDEILKDGNEQDVITKKGAFVYRLSGRDRQKSASYYTPEVLTRCTVKYTLKPILEKLDKGEMKSTQLLELKLLEPAMGAAAFHNEMINQLAEAYLNYRQAELKDSGRKEWRIAPNEYKEELQKVKAYIATNNTYGVDLNPTAIELGKLSLWLNVIHKDMETPFFSNRLAVGNAVVGAWLKVYNTDDLAEELDANGRPLRRQPKKEWWDTAPRQLTFTPSDGFERLRHGRKKNEIYHFLLPDKNMVPSAGIRMLKEEYPAESRAVTTWKREWCKPLQKTEIEIVRRISDKIDEVLMQYYHFQRTINRKTSSKHNIFGAYKNAEQGSLALYSYDDKERLADQRNRHDAPYFKLRMIMDYWCSLWFWDVRHAGSLPDRQQYWKDIEQILQMDVTKKSVDYIASRRGNQKLFETSIQTELPQSVASDNIMSDDEMVDVIIHYTDKQNIFDDNQRLHHARQLAEQYHFFHPQLEFLEVFWERGGFDLIAGNPPWLKVLFEEKGIISEKFPEVAIRSVSAPQVRTMQAAFFDDHRLKELYIEETIGTECAAVFLNAGQNYPLLVGQQTNLYKCILENGFTLLSKGGFMGLLHPEGVYDDPNGQVFRKEIYQRLVFHFQFRNQLKLFAEIGDRVDYGIHIYTGLKPSISFNSINNLFHPATIDGCFIHDGSGLCGGIKIKGDGEDGFVWNTKPHKERIVNFTLDRLKVLALTFENSEVGESAKLVSIHSFAIIKVLEKLSGFESTIQDFQSKITEGWHETNDIDLGIIRRETKFPTINQYEMIYSGPHIFGANPLYKTPKETCTEKAHYDIIDHTILEENFIARTNYVPHLNIDSFPGLFSGFRTGSQDSAGNEIFDRWIDYYKLGFRKMLSQAGERTLNPGILIPKSTHTNGVISIIFRDNKYLIEFAALASSVVLDFFIKTVGASNLTDNRLSAFPLGVKDIYKPYLFNRVLLLNCLNKYYTSLWEENFNSGFKKDHWSKSDTRLKTFNILTPKWDWYTPLRNLYERRWALVEIDVITAMAFGLTLEELTLIYNVQFPVLQQNEDDTWYDTKGNIVFTCSKGLVGVGVDRPVWEQIRNLEAGQTYEHIITKSELYQGKKVVYYAPFDKCDRVEDYKVAWKHFEKVFSE